MPLITINDLGQGVVKDIMPEELKPGAWSDVMNMRFRDGFAERFRGMQDLFATPLITPYWVTPYASSATRFWVHAGLQKAYVDDGTNRFEITNTTPFTGAVDDRWSGGSLNGVLVMNNGVDQPQYWGGVTAGTGPETKLRVLPGWDSTHRAAWMRPWKNQLWCGDVTKNGVRYPHMLKGSWSAVPGAVPAGWAPSDPAQDGIERDLAETPDFQVDALPLGNSLIVYKQRSMYAITQTFDTRIISSQRLPGNSGMLARGCGVQIPTGHVVLTNGDVIIHNGQGPKSLLSGRMRRWLFNMMDSQVYQRAFVTSNPQRNEVWVCFPSSGSTACDMALIWNWETDTFGIRTLEQATFGDVGQLNPNAANQTWDSRTVPWDSDATSWGENEYAANEARTVFSHTKPRVSLVDVGTSDFGMNFRAWMERTGISLGDTDSMKVVRNTRFRFDAAANTPISIQVGTHKTPGSPVSWGAIRPFLVSDIAQIEVNSMTQAGRYMAVRVFSDGPQPWRVRSMDIDVVTAGRY